MKKERELKKRLKSIIAAASDFIALQNVIESGWGVDAEKHDRAYRKLKRLTKKFGAE